MGLIAHYRLDGDATDAVGDNHGTASGVTWVDGKLGKAGDFIRGPGNGVWIPHDEFLSQRMFGVRTTLSFSFWIYVRSYANHGIIIGKQSGNSYSNSTSTVWINSGSVRFILGTNEGGNPTGSVSIVSVTPAVDTWHHIACAADGETMRMYLNGGLAAEGPVDLTRPRSENSADIQIGTPRLSGNNEGVDAVIDDVRIYDHALSQREVRDLSLGLELEYKAPNNTLPPADSSGQGNDAVSSHTNVTIDTVDNRTGFRFNRLSGGIDTGELLNVDKLDAFTASFWINPENHSDGASAAAGIFGKGHYYSNTWDIFILNNNSVRFECSGDPTRNGYTTVNVYPILNVWTHYAVRYDAGAITVFLNGEIVATGTYSGVGGFTNGNTCKIGIRHIDTNRIFGGLLGDIKFQRKALTDAEIKELYQQRASIDSEGSVHTPLLDDGVDYVSPMSSAQTGWPKQNVNYDVTAESDPCSGPLTFQQALDYVEAQGGRLPTREEMAAGVTAGTGCGYDDDYCWTCEKGADETEHWVSFGNPVHTSAGPDQLRSNTSTAMVRFVADDDLDRPDPTVINDALIREWLFT